MMRYLIMACGGVGGLAFILLWGLTFLRPDFVVETSRYVISTALYDEIDRRVDTLPAFLAKRIASTEEQRERLKAHLQGAVAETLYNVVAHRSVPEPTGLMGAVHRKIAHALRQKYQEVVGQLTHDFRLFTGLSGGLFLAVTLTAFLCRDRIRPLLVPTGLLLLATGFMSYSYIFMQDWLYTIIFNDYMGWYYLVYVGLVFALLCDITLNRARVLRALIDGITSLGN
ncbi:hypothetical protein HQN64_08510 [Enterobacteriaceae bacterium BIT-l23]|uniref:hypothetical protein n=1 Tax=Jejubacter sp. L23 TaxID=3092086 RepID=UPI0015845970|nr:hypothetical protein [Enterobacteriaceae bacterium BIT-l23]